MTAKSSPRLGQPVVGENKGRAGGSVGTDAVVKAPPDGYNRLLAAQTPTQMLHVPCKGTSRALNDPLARQLQVLFGSFATSSP